jgi:hypothetical protein
LTASETQNVLAAVTGPLTADFALQFGPKLDPSSVPLSVGCKVMSKANLNFITNSTPADLLSNLQNTDLGNMDNGRLAILNQQVKYLKALIFFELLL